MFPLLRTKTTIPPVRPRRIERPLLLERMAEGSHRALTLIIAPAGFGKTTLAATWAQTTQMPVAWLSLQPADRPRERFLSYLIQALQTISPPIGQTTLALLQGSSPEGALFALANDLAEVKGDFALVLDDYHSVDSPKVTEVLQFLLENRPPTFHIVLTTRSITCLSFTRLRALDQVIEITTDDLRFTPEEIRVFLETCMDLCLPAEALARLNQSTEGWVVGLQLAALTLARQPDNWQVLAGHEHIFDYLAEEVLHRENSEVQGFLKITSLFDRFCAPLCEHIFSTNLEAVNSSWSALAGSVNTAQTFTSGREPYTTGEIAHYSAISVLSYIERANLFLVPLDSTSTWYRYHPLFTDFLRRQVPPEQAASYCRLASGWFEQNGLLDDAIHYATHAGDHERAASLLEHHYIDMLQRGEQAAFSEWISALPPGLLDKHPRLWLAQGWASIISLNSTMAAECAEKAEALIPPGDAGDRLRGEAKSLRFLSNIFVGKVSSDEFSSAYVLLAEQDDFLHSLLHFNIGLHHVVKGQTAQAVDAFTETLRLTATLKNPLVAIITQVQLGETRQLRGALGLAGRTFEQAVRYAKETLGLHTFLLGMPYISYAELLREQNRFDEAARYAEQGIAYCQVWQPVASMDGHITLARLLAAQGRWDEAYTRVETALQIAETNVSIIDDTFIAIQLVRLALLQGDLTRAAHIIQAYELEKNAKGMYYLLWELTQLILLRAQAAALPADPALAQSLIEALTALIAESECRGRVTPVIEALILRTYALHAANRHTETAKDLTRALTLGAQGGYVRIFADEGRQLQHLLEQYRAKIHAPRSYFNQILKLLRQESTLPAPAADLSAPEGLLPLTRRELDILQLLAAGKSNQEIAAERILALNTVKKHVANILSKLGVANRTQAVILAKKLGWME